MGGIFTQRHFLKRLFDSRFQPVHFVGGVTVAEFAKQLNALRDDSAGG